MNTEKLNIRRTLFLFSFLISVLLIGMSLEMLVGITYGRYSTTISAEIEYDVQAKPVPHITYSDLGNGEGVWFSDNEKQTLEFTVSNTDGTSVYEDDISLRIRMFLPNAEGDAADPLENKNLTVKVNDGKSYTATHSALNEDTALYSKNSAGWIYTFESQNVEYIHVLKGKEESELSVTMTVDSDADISKYILLVDFIQSDKVDNKENGGAS